MSNLEGAMLSEYLLLKCISRGGMADVYRARQHTGGNYEVAVKVFRPGYAQRQSFRDYFMAEAEKIGQLDHANILPFLEFGEGDGLLYTVTPLVSTGTLEDLLGRVGGRLSAMQALPAMQQLCSAVQYAHAHEVIHGNIKPTNIFIGGDGRVLLADFGIARGYDDSQQSLTRMGWGSAEYTAPEQSLGILRHSSDIYTLGVLLFRILTGQPPFVGQTPVEVLLKHVRQQPPSARLFAPNISGAVDGVLLMAMQKRSDDRFASAQEFSDAFTAAVSVAPVASPVAQPVQVAPGLSPSIGDPQTPFPTYLNVTPPVPPVPPHAPSPLGPSRLQTPSTTMGGRNAYDHASSNAAPPYQNFLQEEEDSGTSIFEWVGPVEWSPIGNGQSLPFASEYLRSMPMAPEVPPAPAPTLPLPPPSQEKKVYKTREESKPSSPLKKILPIVVVILLLLGLLAALLSSFLYPGGAIHSNSSGNLLLHFLVATFNPSFLV